VGRVLNYARRQGISLLDTAADYGESEAVLGRFLEPGHGFRIVTKTPRLGVARVTAAEASALRSAYERSLARLRQDRLYGVLIHAVDELLAPGGERLWEAMTRLGQEKLVEKIGVSVYSAAQIDAVLDRFQPDLVQVPVNVLDQRLLASRHLSRMKSLRIEIHGRSVFLQGLLLSPGTPLDPYFTPYRHALARVEEVSRRLAVSPLALALGFVKALGEVDAAVVGVTRLTEVEENVAAWREANVSVDDCSALACQDEALVNPALWKLRAAARPEA
jgi:aryl-alcohol dehydrogenase-like predicted oxidoreductase